MAGFVDFEYWVLQRIAPPGSRGNRDNTEHAYAGKSKLVSLLGGWLEDFAGKTVLDFGCGHGNQTIELARSGAAKAIGLDIRESVLEVGRRNAAAAGLSERCEFATSVNEPVDLIVSLDAFEHFEDPAAILRIMDSLLKADGEVLISFGPTWLHPLGGHAFSVFPWAHLVFSEPALLRWRANFKLDGATRFHEVEGGLNQMTIARFEALVAASPFRLATLELAPIRKLKVLHNRLTREFTTAVVRCRLVKKARA